MFGWLKRNREPEPIEYDYTVEPMKIDRRNTIYGIFAADDTFVGVLNHDPKLDTYYSTALDHSFVEVGSEWELAQALIDVYAQAD